MRIRALKVFLVFRGAWAAVARRLRGWFGERRCRCGSVTAASGSDMGDSAAYNCMGYTAVQSDGGGGVVGGGEGGCGGGSGVLACVCVCVCV
jgi:hypothetical protein